ncbi:MAG: hypothetical protein JXX29_16210 [Deltaproteobacteria bacterium]|nr:hypothetical protein [Deltaproteobacteria bacterium]MBN2673227.1 hypothetical protein [Deltaproteobacteria bacterium]
MRITEHYRNFTRNMYDSYLAIRKAIGILGMSLPLIVIGLGALVHQQVADSLSGYYYTSIRDVFESFLFASGLLLIVYQGNNKLDKYLTTAAGILAIGVVTFPTEPASTTPICEGVTTTGIFELPFHVSRWFHIASAISFFVVMAIVCLFRFTKHQDNAPEERKRLDFRYKVCGFFILVGATVTFTFKLFFPECMKFYPVLVAEAVSLAAIGYGWFLKGNK